MYRCARGAVITRHVNNRLILSSRVQFSFLTFTYLPPSGAAGHQCSARGSNGSVRETLAFVFRNARRTLYAKQVWPEPNRAL